MHSTVCTVIDLFMCVCHILLINYYYYYHKIVWVLSNHVSPMTLVDL